MTKRLALVATTALVVLLVPNLAFAQANADTNAFDMNSAIAIAAGFGMAIAAAICGLAQSKAIARNPGQVRFEMPPRLRTFRGRGLAGNTTSSTSADSGAPSPPAAMSRWRKSLATAQPAASAQ